jgi:hypothetical protein
MHRKFEKVLCLVILSLSPLFAGFGDMSLSSSTHDTVNQSNRTDISFSWAAPQTDSGTVLNGYYYQLDQSSGTLVNDSHAQLSAAASSKITSAEAGDGNYYFHLAPFATDGEIGATVHFGPIKIDTTAPSALSITPEGGTYSEAQTVSMRASDANNYTIYYTDNGDTPTNASTQYSVPITVSSSKTLKAIAIDSAGNQSNIKSVFFTINTSSNIAQFGEEITAGSTVATNSNGNSEDVKRELSVEGTSVTHYKYKVDTGTFGAQTEIDTKIDLSTLNEGTHTLSLIGYDGTSWQSEASATKLTFTVDNTEPSTVEFSIATGTTITTESTLTLTSANSETIYYTTDESDPSSSNGTNSASKSFTSSDNGTVTIKAVAYDSAKNKTEIVQAVYTVNIAVDEPEPEPEPDPDPQPVVTYTSIAVFGEAITDNSIVSVSGNSPTAISTISIGGEGVLYYKYKADEESYSSMINVNEPIDLTTLLEGNHTLYALAYNGNRWQRDPTTLTLNIDNTAPLNAVFTPVDGSTILTETNITIASEGASSIYYTTDSSDPSKDNGVLGSSIPISQEHNGTFTLKAIAYDDVNNSSEIVTAVYTVEISTPVVILDTNDSRDNNSSDSNTDSNTSIIDDTNATVSPIDEPAEDIEDANETLPPVTDPNEENEKTEDNETLPPIINPPIADPIEDITNEENNDTTPSDSDPVDDSTENNATLPPENDPIEQENNQSTTQDEDQGEDDENENPLENNSTQDSTTGFSILDTQTLYNTDGSITQTTQFIDQNNTIIDVQMITYQTSASSITEGDGTLSIFNTVIDESGNTRESTMTLNPDGTLSHQVYSNQVTTRLFIKIIGAQSILHEDNSLQTTARLTHSSGTTQTTSLLKPDGTAHNRINFVNSDINRTSSMDFHLAGSKTHVLEDGSIHMESPQITAGDKAFTVTAVSLYSAKIQIKTEEFTLPEFDAGSKVSVEKSDDGTVHIKVESAPMQKNQVISY